MSKKAKLSTEPYKGVRDFYPEESAALRYILATWRGVVEKFGYVEYKASILEPAELYKNKGVENEEIINEQTYTFTDRGGREVTLRPEMTPTVARMVAAKRRELGFPLRLYSIPNVFRYERPQRGRLREHWQLNVDLFGSRSPMADAEILAIAHKTMLAFGATGGDFVIKVGSRKHLNALMDEYALPEDSRGSFLYLLDRRAKMPAPEFEAELAKFKIPIERLSAGHVPADVQEVLTILTQKMLVKNIVFDPSVVRGFNYYTGIIFEVFDTHADNNRSLFGGGRYDNLTEMFDDEATPGVGFGMGDVTMRDFLEVRGLLPEYSSPTKLYIAVTSPELALEAQIFAEDLRAQGITVAVDFGDKKLADQIKNAAKHKIPHLIVLGPDEVASGEFVVRDLASGKETPLKKEALPGFF